ncbi:LysR family transcriptional regulator [Novosphingobium sp. BL-52-GroH]|uniref:LysR family transcriptional regulator n=1 Tax=Novosphingobium sp. BL-52-GroH TaxID=3349877 RepID=UPI00384CEAFD
MDRFNLNLFFALDAILHADTLTEAARNVHLTQPAMSVSLKKLRAYFEDELVVYQNGQTRFTAKAIALKPRIRQVLQAARETLGLSLAFDPAVDARTIRVTTADVVELIYLSRVTASIAQQAPHVDVISTPFTYQPVDMVFRENIDVAIVSAAFSLPDYPSLHLFDETISCMLWDGNAQVGETLSEAQYFGGRHAAMFHTTERLAHPVGAALHRLNLQRNIAVRASVYSALPHMIVGTDLIVTTLTRFAHLCARTMPVRVVAAPVEMPVIPFVAQWQDYRSDEPVIQWLLTHLKEAAHGL